MASLETTRGRQVPAWQQANRYYQQPTDYVAEMQPRSQSATAPATRKRRKTNGGYTIQKGDTLSDIARRYGTTVQAIAEVNGITDVNKIYVGDNLNIPGTTQNTTNTARQSRTTSNPTAQTTVNQEPVGRVLPTARVVANDDKIYSPNTQLNEVRVSSARPNNDDIIRARYQRQINNQRARNDYYNNQRMQQGRQMEQVVADRADYEGLRNFAIGAAAAPGTYLFGTAAGAAAPYIAEGANPRNWIEAGNRAAETVNRAGARIARNRVARENVKAIKEANRLMEQPARPINSRRTMKQVRRIQKGRSTQNNLATAKPRPTAQYENQAGPSLGNYYRRSPTEAQQNFLNQVDAPRPVNTTRVKRAPRSKQGSKKTRQ